MGLQLPRARARSALTVSIFTFATLAASGCIDAKQSYEEFVERQSVPVDAGPSDDGMSRDASETADDGQSTSDVDAPLSACDELLQQNLDGQYFTACLPVATQLPFFLSVNQKVTRSPNGGPPILDFSFTPLLVKATDTSQTVGDLVTLPPVPIHDDCTFDEVIGTLTLPKLANSLDRELVAEEAVLHGRFVSAERSCAGLFATVPLINLKLNGDHCVFIKLPPGSPVPTVSAQDYDCGPPAPAP
jgi:hypothetical protein